MDLLAPLSASFGREAGLALLATIAAALALAGIVKGLLGAGLPLVAVPLMSLAIPSTKAIALMAVPVLVSNLWQAAEGGIGRRALRRFAPLLVPLVLATLLTVRVTVGLPADTLKTLVAVALLSSVALMAFHPKLEIAPSAERRWSVGVGLISGVLGGVSSLMGPLVITYLVALGLSREQFVGSISVIYLAAALPLYGGMIFFGVLGLPEFVLSVLALAPMFAGMAIGRRLRQRTSEAAFRRILLGFLTLLAVLLLLKS